MSSADLCDPVEAYVKPIRSVLFVDDQFPTFAHSDVTAFSEAERARALWEAFTKMGLLCDMDNSPDWASSERKQRLAACDLLVLDFHLVGDDSRPALTIIHDLARSESPNMVVVYTQDPRPGTVLLTIAGWARGVGADVQLPEDIENIESTIPWSSEDIIAFLKNKEDWKNTVRVACEQAGLPLPEDSQSTALLERKLRRELGAQASAEIRPIDEISFSEHRWLQCGNLFLVVISKAKDSAPEAEAEAFLGRLKDAVRQWSPHWLACLMAHSRRQVEAGAFRDDVLVPDEPLKGLLEYISDPQSDPPERERRAREVATHLLSRRSDEAAKALGKQLQERAASQPHEELTERDALHLNAFLCTKPFNHHHLHMGTIFALRTNEPPEYWVCVTPACDMVPRQPDEGLNPWATELDPFRPIVALRLKLLTGSDIRKKALPAAHRSRHLFFLDQARKGEQPVVAASFRETADPNPWIEQLLAADRARVQKDGSVQLYRLVAKKSETDQADAPTLELINCEPVAQLRAPYAERVVQVVGGHVSRIGVDFVPFKAPK